jgi:hypothetical protein
MQATGVEARYFNLWLHQHQRSFEATEEASAALSSVAKAEQLCHQEYVQATERAQESQKHAGWFSVAQRIFRIASAVVTATRGDWKSMACGAGLIGLEVASMTGAIDQAAQKAGELSPAAGAAVRVGAAAASIGLGTWSVAQGVGQGGIGGVLQSTLAISSGISSVGQGVTRAQSKRHEAAALAQQAKFTSLAASRARLHERLQAEASYREKLLAQQQESLDSWHLMS